MLADIAHAPLSLGVPGVPVNMFSDAVKVANTVPILLACAGATATTANLAANSNHVENVISYTTCPTYDYDAQAGVHASAHCPC